MILHCSLILLDHASLLNLVIQQPNKSDFCNTSHIFTSLWLSIAFSWQISIPNISLVYLVQLSKLAFCHQHQQRPRHKQTVGDFHLPLPVSDEFKIIFYQYFIISVFIYTYTYIIYRLVIVEMGAHTQLQITDFYRH